MADIIAASNAAADSAGIPRLLLLAAACAESGLNPFARRPVKAADDQRYWPDVSGGAWQQTVRWDPDYRGGAAYPGPAETERVLALQYDPVRSAGIAAANLRGKYRGNEPDAVFRALCRYNWPAGDGEPVSAEIAANYRRGIAEAAELLGVPPVTVTFNPNEPNIAQNDPWSCSCTSARWALKAVGRNPSEQWIEDTMLAEGVVTREHGLMDASGAGLASFLKRHYGEYGYDANNEPSVSFDWCAAEGDHAYPVLIGGRGWNHWAALRGFDAATGRLWLMNPAPNWMGIGDWLDASNFNALGPFSAVRLWHPDLLAPQPAPPPPPAPEPPKPLTLAEWKAGLLAWIDRMPVG